MRQLPVSNDASNPLLSVFVYNYYLELLAQCLEHIVNQNIIENLEIILFDNASTDGSWEIALKYVRQYEGIITIKRNKRVCENLRDSYFRRLAKGKYFAVLTQDNAFPAEYIQQCIKAMESDPFARNDIVKRTFFPSPSRPNIKSAPLVSVLIHNYNYGRFLGQCLESVFNQTYENFEILLSDNASTDDSWDIAVEYARRNPGKMTLTRNRRNFGPEFNLENCYADYKGKYYFVLCSDDALMPDYISKCVQALESHPEAGFAMTHRAILNDRGERFTEPPFYSQSCLIPGWEQAAVYMLASVNPSISQVMYNRAKALGLMPSKNLVTRWFGARLLDFNLCCEFPMLYLKEPLLLHRVHSGSDSAQISGSLVEIFGQYILPHLFVEMARSKNNLNKTIDRLPQALAKLARLCLRYSVRSMAVKDFQTALRYFHLGVAIDPEIKGDLVFKKIEGYWLAGETEKEEIMAELLSTDNLISRKVSYDPPPNSLAL